MTQCQKCILINGHHRTKGELSEIAVIVLLSVCVGCFVASAFSFTMIIRVRKDERPAEKGGESKEEEEDKEI